MNFAKIKNKLIISSLIFFPIVLLLIFWGKNTSYHNADQTILANDLRNRAGIFDEWGNLKSGMHRVEFFPGVSDFCESYIKSHGNSGSCLSFYVNISESDDGLGRTEEAVKGLFSKACLQENFCKEKGLKLIEIYFVKKDSSELQEVNFGAKKFGLVKKVNYIPGDGSWKSM